MIERREPFGRKRSGDHQGQSDDGERRIKSADVAVDIRPHATDEQDDHADNEPETPIARVLYLQMPARELLVQLHHADTRDAPSMNANLPQANRPFNVGD